MSQILRYKVTTVSSKTSILSRCERIFKENPFLQLYQARVFILQIVCG